MINQKQIIDIVNEVEEVLISMPKIKFEFDRLWSSKFPYKAGVYAIFDNEKLIYIGETANLKERMKEVKRTYNHSFRKKLGKHLYDSAVIVKGKFKEEIELALNDYYINRISFAYAVVDFGRLEVETHLINSYKNKGILNSIGKRNRINYEINS